MMTHQVEVRFYRCINTWSISLATMNKFCSASTSGKCQHCEGRVKILVSKDIWFPMWKQNRSYKATCYWDSKSTKGQWVKQHLNLWHRSSRHIIDKQNMKKKNHMNDANMHAHMHSQGKVHIESPIGWRSGQVMDVVWRYTTRGYHHVISFKALKWQHKVYSFC